MNKKNRKKTKNRYNRLLLNDKNSQVIVIAGVVMFISIIFISSLAPEVANISIDIASEKSSSIAQEFLSLKKIIPYLITFNLAENITLENNNFKYYGNMSNLTSELNLLKNDIRTIEFKQNADFDIKLNDYFIANPGNIENVYHLNLTISLRNMDEKYNENVFVSIVCNPLKN